MGPLDKANSAGPAKPHIAWPATEPAPWQVPNLPEDATAAELPEAVAAAARRALGARRPGVVVADLLSSETEPGRLCFTFAAGDVPIELIVALDTAGALGGGASTSGSRVDDSISDGLGPADRKLRISCPPRPHASVEVMHRDGTLKLTLDSTGSAAVLIAPGLLSVLVERTTADERPLQTSWVRAAPHLFT